MIRNYLTIALRHLQKNKLYALVNIGGLAVGIASCLLIGIYIFHELSFDKFHEKAERIVRVTWHYNFGDAETQTATTGTKVGPQLQRSFPEIEAYVRMLKYPRTVGYNEKLFEEKNFLYVDSAFFSVFSFPLVSGHKETVLNAPEKIVLSHSMARKYFGEDDPVGKILKVGGTKDFLITGIAEDPPSNSQVKFDFLASFSTLNAAKTEKWNEANYITYLLLKQKENIIPLQKKITGYAAAVAKEEMQVTGNNFMNFLLEPFTKVHLFSRLDGLEPNNTIVYIYILGAVALLILLIACVNFTNLSTAQSAGRSGEIGMRKVMGAGKTQIFFQFIAESFVTSFIAVVLAIIISSILLPYFNQLSGKNFAPSILFQPLTAGIILILSIIIAFTAGVYPALILSGSKVINVLKSGFRFTGSGSLRKSLIVFQFIISLFLLISTIVILQQLSFIRNKDLGYDKDRVMVLPLDAKMRENYDDLKMALKLSGNVVSVAGAYESPVHIGWSDGLKKGAENEYVSINALPVDEDFTSTLGLKFIAGREFNLTDVRQFDTSDNGNNLRYSFILNEAAVKALGWKPEEAIGKTVTKGREGIVTGVVKDFHFRSFHESIGPLAIFLDKRILGNLFIKTSGDTRAAISGLNNIWKQRVPHRPFEYAFLDEEYEALYLTEQRMAGVFTTFSLLAILLACLGLFALTAFSMVQRTKEIGIRKILGATVTDILTLVSKDFLKLILVATIISVPLSILAMQKWLEGFVYKTSLQWWVFVAAALLTLMIAFLTISLQAVKTAITNPVKNLRTE